MHNNINKKLTNKHLLLMLLYSPGLSNKVNEPIRGRTRLMKMIFLFKEELQKEFLKEKRNLEFSLPEFYPWHYGPFSKDVFNDLEFFRNNSYIIDQSTNEEKSNIEAEEYENWIDDYLLGNEKEIEKYFVVEEYFKLTQKGEDWVKNKLFDNLTEKQKELLHDFKRKFNAAPLESIIRYTYLQYPQYTNASKIRESVFGK